MSARANRCRRVHPPGTGERSRSAARPPDGNTLVVGSPDADDERGAAWVFVRSGESWTQQGDKLTGAGGVSRSRFGSAVALSADGNTVLIGGEQDNFSRGAAWVFTRSGATW